MLVDSKRTKRQKLHFERSRLECQSSSLPAVIADRLDRLAVEDKKPAANFGSRLIYPLSDIGHEQPRQTTYACGWFPVIFLVPKTQAQECAVVAAQPPAGPNTLSLGGSRWEK